MKCVTGNISGFEPLLGYLWPASGQQMRWFRLLPEAQCGGKRVVICHFLPQPIFRATTVYIAWMGPRLNKSGHLAFQQAKRLISRYAPPKKQDAALKFLQLRVIKPLHASHTLQEIIRHPDKAQIFNHNVYQFQKEQRLEQIRTGTQGDAQCGASGTAHGRSNKV